MSSVRVIRCEAEQPETILERELKKFTAASPPQLLVAVDFSLECYWLRMPGHIALVALYHLIRRPDGVHVQLSVCPPERLPVLPERCEPEWPGQLDVPWFDLGAPLPLCPVSVAKPWGREIWYTGIEERGVATVCNAGGEVPLPWLLAIAPQRFCHSRQRQLILLKILDPLPDPVFGDLYFELHREKREVYVVTAVDGRAWPNGVGAIRYGFDPALRERYGDDRRFLEAYRQVVLAYRDIRLEIDALLDAACRREQQDPAVPADAATQAARLDALPAALRAREAELRAAMDAFTGTRPLQVGDVVKVPPLFPHSLQHGVRTVEFQTPVYERLILSFAQKVLTQPDWDTDEALDILLLDPPAEQAFEVLAEDDGWREERIVEFDDFEVRRITLQPGAAFPLRSPSDYALCMAIGDALRCGDTAMAADEAFLLPPIWRGARIVNDAAEPRVLLVAYPRVVYP